MKRIRFCLILMVMVMCFSGCGIAAYKVQNDIIQKSVSGASDESEYITMEEFNKIETGMSYEEVKDIIGSPGEMTSQVEVDDIQTMIVTWYGNGMAGSNANVTFLNNEVMSKAQFGLK